MPSDKKEYEYKFRPLSKLDKHSCFVDLRHNPFMRTQSLLFCLLFLTIGRVSMAEGEIKTEKDVSGRLVPQIVNGEIDPAVLTFQAADGDQQSGFFVSSEQPFSVYAGEHLLAASVFSFRWNADSLNILTDGSRRLTFFRQHREPLRLIQTGSKTADPLDPIFRNRSGVMNFTILSGALLLIFFSVALSGFSGPVRSTAAILSIFSLNIREDRTDETRINSSSSFFRFSVVTLFASVMLTIIRKTDDESTGYYFLTWGGNLLFLTLFFVAKVLLTIFWAWIFNQKDSANHQVTSFFRTVLFLCVGAGIFMLLNFTLSVSREPENFLLGIFTPLIFTVFGLTLFLRLMKISTASPLHLFSYLCISEFIPLVLLVYTI